MPVYKIEYDTGEIEKKFFKNRDLLKEYIEDKKVLNTRHDNGVKIYPSHYKPDEFCQLGGKR